MNFQKLEFLLLTLGSLLLLPACGRFISTASPTDPTALAALDCRPMESFSAREAPTSEEALTASQAADPEDQEKSDDYSNPFMDINHQFDENSPEIKKDLTPDGPIKDQAVGSYSGQNSRLENPSNLFLKQLSYGDLSPFKIIYPSRRTFFGTADMIQMIDYLGTCLRSMLPTRKLLIGDISAEHGGPLGGHQSHRIGMDADIAYLQPQGSQSEAFETITGPDLHQKILLKEQIRLFQSAVMTNRVDRIFVHPQIRASLCETARNLGALSENSLIGETFRRIVGDINHGSHFHVRLKCSKAQPRCIPTADPPKGSGC
jgi:penicillin-insensitive murein endopeptidase